jgi:putative holliday junction resolvase
VARTPGGVLAIDPGDKKCGFATSDALGLVNTPLAALRHEGREEELFRHIETLLGERDIATLVVGLPLNLDGSAGERALLTRGLVARLQQRFPALDVQEWDERLTTKEAESRLRELGRKGRAIRAERDSWSALVLLEDWLHSHGGFSPRD